MEQRHATALRRRRDGRRLAEFTCAAVVLVLASPAMGVIAVVLAAQGARPPLYGQTRVGHGGRRFRMLKFRTLGARADGDEADLISAVGRGELGIGDAVATLKGDVAVCGTRFGRWLRRTSLDELPQLWHVLRGDMALVGPRPLRPFEVDALAGWQLRRHDVPPGITGLWQISGRSEIPWDTRMELDYFYVKHRSVKLDLMILARTPLAVLRRKGAL